MSTSINQVLSDLEKKLNEINAMKNKIYIVNAGITNNGKSSTFNSLLRLKGKLKPDASDEMAFKVKDVRTTIKNKEIEYCSGVYLLDTPGLEAEDQDEKIALDAYKKASLIVFVHKIRAGELHADEIKWISDIQKCIPADELKKHFCIVLTHELKQERVKKSVNNFVDRLLSGDDEKTGMAQIRNRLNMIHQKRDSYVHTMEERKQRICRRIKDQMFLRIREKAEVWDEEVAKGHMIKSDEAEKEVLSIVQQHISEGINQEVEKIIDNFKGVKQGTFIADLNVGGIEKQTKTIEKEYHKKVVHRRSANGLWENVRSFFGKKYYDVSIETVKKQIHIDMGSNMEDYMERLKPALDKAVENFVAEALANIEKEYFAPQEQYAKQMEAAMERLHQKLESVKF